MHCVKTSPKVDSYVVIVVHRKMYVDRASANSSHSRHTDLLTGCIQNKIHVTVSIAGQISNHLQRSSIVFTSCLEQPSLFDPVLIRVFGLGHLQVISFLHIIYNTNQYIIINIMIIFFCVYTKCTSYLPTSFCFFLAPATELFMKKLKCDV